MLIGLVMLSSFGLVAAQEDTGWPIEQRCVGEPTAPPEGWTFDGTILLKGHYGIHAVRADLDTPYVAAFIDQYQLALGGERLSPDGKWYAVVEGQRFDWAVGLGLTVHTSGIRVISTIQNERYYVPWKSHYFVGNLGIVPELYWYDNEHLVYQAKEQTEIDEIPTGAYLINPFSAEVISWEGDFFPGLVYMSVSPNWTQTVYKQGNGWAFTNGEGTKTLIEGGSEVYATWQADSSQFAVRILRDGQSELSIYDHNGNLTDTVFKGDILFANADKIRMAWSPDNQYLAFIAREANTNTVHIANVQQRQIVDTCITADSLAWSPDSKQLAVLIPSEERQGIHFMYPVGIFELESETLHIAAYHAFSHNARIIGWRAE